MDRRTFFALATAWDVDGLRAALEEKPVLARTLDPTGMTALHALARARGKHPKASIAAARLLLDAGADVNAVREIDDHGEVFRARPAWYALAWGKNPSLARFLFERGASPQDCVWAVAYAQDIELLALIAERGADLDALFRGKTALLESVVGKRFDAVDALLAHGADPNVPDPDGYTPLHHAIERGHPVERVKALLARGARIDARARMLARERGTGPLLELLGA